MDMFNVPAITEEEIVEGLLQEWGCIELYKDFKDFGVDFEVLKVIEEDDIRDLIPREKIGLRVKFKQRLKEWRLANGFSNAITGTLEAHSVCDSVQSWITGNCSNSPCSSKSSTNINLKSILCENFAGKSLLTEYEKTNRLSMSSRGILANIIIDYLISSKVAVAPSIFLNILEEIKALFPTEEQDIYYTPRLGNTAPRGKLIDKYYARCKKYRKLGVIESKYKPRNIALQADCVQFISSTSDEETEIEDDYKWLLHNRDPPELLSTKWKSTFQKRRREILASNTDILRNWPPLKLPSGYIYIELDFEQLFPGTDVLLFSKWEEFSIKIEDILQRNIKDPSSRILLQLLKKDLCNDARNLIICLLLNAVLIPRILQFRKGDKKISWKPSILDAQNGFALRVNTNNDIGPAIARQKAKYSELGATMQPCVIVVGEEEDPKEFYSCFNDALYKLPSFLKALSVTFKINQVFNLEYAKECTQVWCLFEKFFYNLKLSTKPNSALSALLSDLNAL